MRGERIGQAEFGREHRAEMARPENPQRHVCSRRRHRLDALIGTGWREEGLHFENVLREILGGLGRAAQGAQRQLVGARRAAEPEVDAARKQPRQRAELFGDDIGRMVGQHDAAGADPDGLGAGGDMANHDRGRGTGDARHVVMLGHPDAPIAPALGMSRKIAGIVECAARIGVFGDADEIEDGKWRHRVLQESLRRRELRAGGYVRRRGYRTRAPPRCGVEFIANNATTLRRWACRPVGWEESMGHANARPTINSAIPITSKT